MRQRKRVDALAKQVTDLAENFHALRVEARSRPTYPSPQSAQSKPYLALRPAHVEDVDPETGELLFFAVVWVEMGGLLGIRWQSPLPYHSPEAAERIAELRLRAILAELVGQADPS